MKTRKFYTAVFISFLIISSSGIYAQSPSKLIKAAKKFYKEKNYQECVSQLTQALALDSSLTEPYVLRAKCYESLERIPEATHDYIRLTELDQKSYNYAYNAGRLLVVQKKYKESIHFLSDAIAIDKGLLEAYLIKIEALINIKNYDEALVCANQSILIKKTATNYYNRGSVYELLSNFSSAEKDFKVAIDLDEKYEKAYVSLANVLIKENKGEEALTYCNKVLKIDANNVDAYATRSRIYYKKSDYMNAISDMTKAIKLKADDDNLYFSRAIYNKDYGKVQEAIEDYSKVIELNKNNAMAYYNRALCYDETKAAGAANDYEKFLEISGKDPALTDQIAKAEKRVFELKSETNKPEIVVKTPNVTSDGSIESAINSKTIVLEANVTDQSRLQSIKVNNVDYPFDKTSKTVTITQEIPSTAIDKITISATDVYNNENTLAFKIKRTEIDPPHLDIISPYTSDYNEIFLEATDTNKVFIEGKVADESEITSIVVDGVDAKFKPDELNPTYTVNINITGKDQIKVKAVDKYGNVAEKTYKLNRESARIVAENPMGKTWVVFIENADYTNFASLAGPGKDMTAIQNALAKYQVHNFIHKRNMTKLQLEKFFSIELRDQVRNNKVNSLIVWYAGHGKFVNETGYWIPTDATRDDEFTYFNVGSLKAAMQSYSKFITHVLVITDACESGPTFYAAMRAGAKKRICGQYEATKFKSSQVFSSAGYELAQDNSEFTKLFAKSLNYNNDDCIAIDNIVIQVTEAVGNEKQKPQFGKIQGLEDEDGTFFFMKKK
jgi:tetratricopeptide (TPR) repeat protein